MTHLAFIAFIIAIVHGGFRDSVVGIKYYADAFVPTPIANPTSSIASSKSVHHYLCEHGPDNKIIGRQYYYQCGTSSTSSSLASTRTSKQEEYNNRVEKEPAPLTLMAVVSRRQSITLSIATILSSATSVAITTQQQPAHADEPNNLYYKAKADEEDPLAVFSKSLQSMSSSSSSTLDNTTERSGASSTSASSTSTTNSDSGASSLSFSDIALPSSGDDSGSSSGAGDLGMALQQKKEEQKGRVDPRTHG